MPRNVRNFWISANVDGRPSSVATGPRRKDGGFDLTIKVREDGGIAPVELHVIGRVSEDGRLRLFARRSDDAGQSITIETRR